MVSVMKTYIKVIAVTTLASAISFLIFQKVLASKNETKINIPTSPAEVSKKYNSFAKNQILCPRANDLESLFDEQSSNQEIYQHCKICQMGALLKDKDNNVSCSYCSSSKL